MNIMVVLIKVCKTQEFDNVNEEESLNECTLIQLIVVLIQLKI